MSTKGATCPIKSVLNSSSVQLLSSCCLRTSCKAREDGVLVCAWGVGGGDSGARLIG